MADQPTPKDSLGRLIQVDVAEIRKLLSKNDMGPAITNGSKKDASEAVEKISKIIGGDFAKDLKSATENLKKITNKLTKKKPEKKDSCCERLLDAIKGLGKLNSTVQDMVEQQEKVAKATEKLAKNSGGGGGGGVGGGGAGGNGGISFSAQADFKDFKNNVVGVIKWMESNVQKMFGNTLTDAWNDAFASSIEYDVQMRRIAFRTQGITEEMTNLLKQWENANSHLDQANDSFRKMNFEIEGVETTGIILAKQQRMQLLMAKKTYNFTETNSKSVRKMTTAAAHSSYMLGANAENTANLFGDWHQKLKLSANDMKGIGRHMVSLSRSTGILGDEMIEVARASEGLLKNLRNQGMLTEERAKNIMSYMAYAKKNDVEESSGKIITALSGLDGLLNKSDDATKRFVITAAQRIGKVNELLSGSLVGKSGLRKITEGAKQNANQILQIYGATLDNMENMTDQQKQWANMQFMKLYGVGIDEYKRMIKTGEDATKSFSDKLKKLNADKASINTSSPFAAEQQAKITKEIQTEMMNAGSDALNAIVKNKGKSADEIIKNLKGSKDADVREMMRDVEAVMKENGVTYSNSEEELRAILMNQAKLIKESGGEDLTGIIKNIDVNNKLDLEAATEKLDQARRKKEIKDSANNTPDRLNQLLGSINDNLAKLAGWNISTLLNWLSEWVIVGGLLVGTLGALGIKLTSLIGGIGNFFNVFRRGGGGFGGVPTMRIPGGGVPPVPGLPGSGGGLPIPRGGPQQRMTAAAGAGGGGKLGWLKKGGGLLKKYLPEIIGAGVGAVGAYSASKAMDNDKETDWTEYASMAAGGIGGAFLGRKAKNWYDNRGAAVVSDAASGMDGMPGFGTDCVPVCVVGGAGLDSLGSTIVDGLSIADTVGDVGSMLKKGDAVADVAKTADVASDAAKGGSWLSRAWGSVKGAASTVSGAAGSAWDATGGRAIKAVSHYGGKAVDAGLHYGGKAVQGAKYYGGKAIEYGAAKFKSLKEAFPSVKGIFQGPVVKGLLKALGPIMTLLQSFGNVTSVISGAKSAQAAGQSVDMGQVGKSIMQSGIYPIANAITTLIPGIGPVISAADGILGAFGMSPIQWLTDNLIDLLPNNLFESLGKFAVGEPQAALASGGIVTKPIHALVGEAGPEVVLPLSKMNNFMNQLFQGANLSKLFNIENLKEGVGRVVSSVAKPIADVYNRVREQNASKTAGISRSAELERIDEVSEKQLERLISIDENIKELVVAMTRNQPIKPSVKSKTNQHRETKPPHSPEWGYWPAYMTAAGMGNVQILSDGVNV